MAVTKEELKELLLEHLDIAIETGRNHWQGDYIKVEVTFDGDKICESIESI